MFRGSLYRSLLRHLFCALTPGVVLLACADPVGDYEEYQVAAQSRSSPPPPSCLPAPTTDEVDISGTFVGYCRVNFADASQALLLATQVSASGGVVDISLTPLLTTAASLNDTAGDPAVKMTAPLLNGQFSINFGLVKISGKANAISGSDIELGDATFKGVVVSKDKFLAELDGGLVKPFVLDLSPAGDICAFVRSPDGVSMPTRPTAEDLACNSSGAAGAAGAGN